MGYFWHSVEKMGPPFLLVDEAVFVIPKGGMNRLSRHNFKFLFILSGEMEHEIEGLEGRRRLGAGDILVAPVVKFHRYINPSPTTASQVQLVRLFLDSEFLLQHAKRRVRRPETDFSDYILHRFSRVSQLTGGIDTGITELLHQLRKETEQRNFGYRHRARCLCTELIIAVSRKLHGPSEESSTTLQENIVNAAKEFILKHLSSDLTLGQIAWHVGKGEEHLARVFKRETGQSVFDYVREMRVDKAKTFLLDPRLSLTTIAERCGFQSLSFFSRTFSQHVGFSPSAYRRHTETRVR